MRRRGLLHATALALVLAPIAAAAQSCLSPGDIVSVPRPAFLGGDAPRLLAVFPDSRTRVQVTRDRAGRVHFRMPITDVPAGAAVDIYALMPEAAAGGRGPAAGQGLLGGIAGALGEALSGHTPRNRDTAFRSDSAEAASGGAAGIPRGGEPGGSGAGGGSDGGSGSGGSGGSGGGSGSGGSGGGSGGTGGSGDGGSGGGSGDGGGSGGDGSGAGGDGHGGGGDSGGSGDGGGSGNGGSGGSGGDGGGSGDGGGNGGDGGSGSDGGGDGSGSGGGDGGGSGDGGDGGGSGDGGSGGSGGGSGGDGGGDGGGPVLQMGLAPVRLALSLIAPAGAGDLVLAQATAPAVGRIASGRICGGGGGTLRPPMSAEALTISLGFGPGGLPAAYRAGADETRAPSAAPEFVLATPPGDLNEALELLLSVGGIILRTESLTNLGLELVVFDLSGAITAAELRALLQVEGIDADVDPNNLFGTSQGRRVYAHDLVGAAPVGRCRVPGNLKIGLIDGPVARDNPYLAGMRLRSWSALRDGERPGSPDHATGVASLLAASPASDGFGGIAPGAQVLSAEAFAAYGARDAASTESISKSIDWLVGERASVVNMSIAGPFNRVFRRIIDGAAGYGVIMVAASGNDGVGQVAYPASDPNVIAVTALDAAKRLYRNASFGGEVEFATPGVEVLVAEGTGSAYRSGTSYAAAVLSGLVAQTLAAGDGGASADEVRKTLQTAAEDLGRAGRDPQFGWGLPRLSDCR